MFLKLAAGCFALCLSACTGAQSFTTSIEGSIPFDGVLKIK